MSYDVQIIADSIGPNGARITTFQLRYPRMVHAELMTHRMFSRNASSTRAIPTAKMIEWIERDPAMPVYWGKNQRGMQATEELSDEDISECMGEWLWARDRAVESAKFMMEHGVHKQIASRILEPWAHINVVLTGTSFDNFFTLRCDKNAMPEIQVLAVKMARAYRDNEPARVEVGDWHLPFITHDEIHEEGYGPISLLMMSVARCARVSYLTFDGQKPSQASELVLYDTLLNNGHWSPFEHQAQAQFPGDRRSSGNFVGWTQHRHALRKSVHGSFDFAKLDEFEGRDFIV